MCVNVLFKDIFSYYVNHFSERIELTFKLLITTKVYFEVYLEASFLESAYTVKNNVFKMRVIVLNIEPVHIFYIFPAVSKFPTPTL